MKNRNEVVGLVYLVSASHVAALTPDTLQTVLLCDAFLCRLLASVSRTARGHSTSSSLLDASYCCIRVAVLRDSQY